ncbi:hypothetical protein [Streptomyces sp. MAI_2237]
MTNDEYQGRPGDLPRWRNPGTVPGLPATGGTPGEAASDAPPARRRQRRLVSGLPAWEPLPPGEVMVVRPRNNR